MIGEIIFNYKIIKKIGEGAKGSVYLAQNQILKEKFVAIKVLNSALSSNEQFKSHFISEARILSNLNHPNIVSIMDFIEQNGNLMFLTEYVQGYPLDIYIEKINGPIQEDRLLCIFLKILDACKYAFNKGVLHGNIKPSNVILLENDVPKILDFGIAKVFNDKSFAFLTDNFKGTIMYMSPEQIKGSEYDFRSDIYSLGVVMFYSLTGQKPFEYDVSSEYLIKYKILRETLPPIRNYFPNISQELESIIIKATQKNPLDRFSSYSELISALENYRLLKGGMKFANKEQPKWDTDRGQEKKVFTMTTPENQTDYTKVNYPGNTYSQNSGMPGYQYKKPKRNNLIPLIIVIVAAVIFLIAGILIYKFVSSENFIEQKPVTQRGIDTLNKNDENDIYDSKTRPKLYFCESYDTELGEIGVSDKFTTGYITVMVDYRHIKKSIGIKNVYLRISQIKDEFGNKIKEKTIRTIPFTVQPEWNYIYFQDKKKINFTTPATYKVTLLDDKYNYITHGVVEIVR